MSDETVSKHRFRREALDDQMEGVQRKLAKRRMTFSAGLEEIFEDTFGAGWKAHEAWLESQTSRAWRE